MSDVKEIAAELLLQLEAPLHAMVSKIVAERIPAAAPVVEAVIEATETVFGLNNPGIGGQPPPPMELNDETDIHTFVERFNALSAKVDALVQATGHGNSAAMGAHL